MNTSNFRNDRVFVVPDSADDTHSAILRSPEAKDGLKGLQDNPRFKHVGSMRHLMREAFAENADRECLGERADGESPYVFRTYAEIKKEVDALGAAMREWGVGKGTHVGLIGPNSAHLTTLWLAVFEAGGIPVLMYVTLGDEEIAHIVKQTDMDICWAASALADRVRAQGVARVIAHEDADAWKAAVDEGQKLIDDGKAKPSPDLCLEDTGALVYTSGTTGLPKGVVLNHNSVLAPVCMSTIVELFMDLLPKDQQMCHLSYMPMSHIYEVFMQGMCLSRGGRIGYSRGKPTDIVPDAAALGPNIFASVPRLYQKLYDGIDAKLRAAGVQVGAAAVLAFPSAEALLAHDKLGAVAKGARAMLGGRALILGTGAAPMTPTLKRFLELVFGARVVEGYGASETAAAACNTMGDEAPVDYARVGFPPSFLEIRLRDVPELGYLHTDEQPRGEVLVRGAVVMQGYWRETEKTKEALSTDGWYSTGDVGRINPDGSLSIVDRVKSLFKLAQGEYVAPGKVEAILSSAPGVAMIFVHGDSTRSNTVAVVVPDPGAIPAEAQSNMRAHLEKTLLDFGRANGLHGFEIPRAVHVCAEPFSAETGVLTATGKLKRPAARKYFEKELEALYA